MIDRRKDAHLIDSILTLFFAETIQLDLLHGILLIVLIASHAVHVRVRSVTNLLNDLEVGDSGSALAGRYEATVWFCHNNWRLDRVVCNRHHVVALVIYRCILLSLRTSLSLASYLVALPVLLTRLRRRQFNLLSVRLDALIETKRRRVSSLVTISAVGMVTDVADASLVHLRR